MVVIAIYLSCPCDMCCAHIPIPFLKIWLHITFCVNLCIWNSYTLIYQVIELIKDMIRSVPTTMVICKHTNNECHRNLWCDICWWHLSFEICLNTTMRFCNHKCCNFPWFIFNYVFTIYINLSSLDIHYIHNNKREISDDKGHCIYFFKIAYRLKWMFCSCFSLLLLFFFNFSISNNFFSLPPYFFLISLLLPFFSLSSTYRFCQCVRFPLYTGG